MTVGMRLGVVVYRRGVALEEILAGASSRLAQAGFRIGGLVPRLGPLMSNGRASLLLDEIGGTETIVISQDRGPGSAGCILDSVALAKAGGFLRQTIAAGVDILLVGRFGKEEATGRGIRGEIAGAILADQACLVAVEEGNLAAWADFAGTEWTALAPDIGAILAWAGEVARPGDAHPPARQ